MKALWLTDIHLEFLDDHDLEHFLQEVNEKKADVVLISGDIAQAPTLDAYLAQMAKTLACPIYFVLGNHDYYHGSIADVRAAVQRLCAASPNLHWLNACGAILLTESTALVGHDGWGDARLGNFYRSQVLLNDFLLIAELAQCTHDQLYTTLQQLGDEAAAHFRAVLPQALARTDHVVVLTHVPPFLEASWHEGSPSDENWLPFFACKAVGEVLKAIMMHHPNKQMTVLCGHTHSGGTAQILPNLKVLTGPAVYRQPAIQEVFVWD